jgi:ubiquinone/menaquinone biosynthesis C-methylase UbiE
MRESGQAVAVLAWNHNAYYQRLILAAVPWGAHRGLDVGCGAGELAARLAERVEHVDALDCDPGMIAAARAGVPDNVTCVLADVMRDPLPAKSYDDAPLLRARRCNSRRSASGIATVRT